MDHPAARIPSCQTSVRSACRYAKLLAISVSPALSRPPGVPGCTLKLMKDVAGAAHPPGPPPPGPPPSGPPPSGPPPSGPPPSGPPPSGPPPSGPPPSGPPYGPPPPPYGPPPHAGPPLSAMGAFTQRHGLVRPVHGRMFAGVCAGFGRATNTDPVLWR